MALTDPYKIRLGDELLAYLDTIADAPEFVRQAVRWARELDLTAASVAQLVEGRTVLQAASRYYAEPAEALQSLLGQAVEATLDSLAALDRAGWTREAICVACDALNGTWLTPGWGPKITAGEIAEANAIAAQGGESLAEKHGVDPELLARLLEALTAETAQALRTVVTEFWRDNRAVIKRLGYGGE